MRVCTEEELEIQIARGPEATFVGIPSPAEMYAEYLEEQKESFAELLLSGDPLTELARKEIAHLLCPELYLPTSKDKPGRPTGTKTFSRDMRITLEYERRYSRGCSDSILDELREEYGFKEVSSIKKALSRIKKHREDRKKQTIILPG